MASHDLDRALEFLQELGGLIVRALVLWRVDGHLHRLLWADRRGMTGPTGTRVHQAEGGAVCGPAASQTRLCWAAGPASTTRSKTLSKTHKDKGGSYQTQKDTSCRKLQLNFKDDRTLKDTKGQHLQKAPMEKKRKQNEAKKRNETKRKEQELREKKRKETNKKEKKR